tara:strand:- start:118 stop:621 length:504 start_codon:yes stop_codon:yes gene_type:complete
MLFVGKTCANELETRANELVFAKEDKSTCPGLSIPTRVTDNCPIANTQIIRPAEGVGFMECTDLAKDRDLCKRYAHAICVGTKTSARSKCYDWYCYNLPKNGDHVVEINGPEYNKIIIRINPPPSVWVVLICFCIIVWGFVMAPELMVGICLGSLCGKDNQNCVFSS